VDGSGRGPSAYVPACLDGMSKTRKYLSIMTDDVSAEIRARKLTKLSPDREPCSQKIVYP
jgi:hypothetical protein